MPGLNETCSFGENSQQISLFLVFIYFLLTHENRPFCVADLTGVVVMSLPLTFSPHLSHAPLWTEHITQTKNETKTRNNGRVWRWVWRWVWSRSSSRRLWLSSWFRCSCSGRSVKTTAAVSHSTAQVFYGAGVPECRHCETPLTPRI